MSSVVEIWGTPNEILTIGGDGTSGELIPNSEPGSSIGLDFLESGPGFGQLIFE